MYNKKETYENRLYIIHLFHIAHGTSCQEKKGCITIVSNLSWLLQSFQSKKKKQTSLFQSFRLIKKDNKTMPMQIFFGEAKFIVGCVNGELGREPGGS